MFWEKPNGNILETNDEKATVEYCESLGFKPYQHNEETDFHTDCVQSLDTKAGVVDYIKDNFGIVIDKRGSLDTVKSKALDVVNGNG